MMAHKDLQPRNSDARRSLAFIPLFMAHQFNPPQFYPQQSQSQQQTPQQQQQQQQRKPLPLSQQQQFPAYDARMMMMMPPPPPQQRPPSTRPGTAGRQQQPSLSQQQQQQQQQQQPSSSSLFQQQHSPQQRFPSQGPFDPQYQQQLLHQQQQAAQHQHQQFSGMSSPVHHQQQHPTQQQQFHPQIQPQSDGRLALHPQSQLQMQMQMQLAAATAQSQAQAQLHQQQHAQSHQIHSGQPVMPGTPTPMQSSPSLRKRKLPHSPSPAPSQHQHQHPSLSTQAAASGLLPPRMPLPVESAPPSSAVTLPGQIHSQTLSLSLNPSITRITSVPLADSGSGSTLPPLSPDDMTNMKTWIDRDKAYEQALKASRERAHRELNGALRAKIGWWEEEVKPRHKMDRERFGILWPDRKRKERSDKLRRAGIRSQGFRFPSSLRSDISNRKEDLIPIRLELDVEHHKLRETFVWNANDPLVKPELLAQSIVDDFKLASHYVHTIAKAIHEQLQEHTAEPEEATTVHNGVLDSTGEAWWGAWRKRIRTQRGYVRTRWQSEDDADDESSGSDKKLLKGRKKRRKLGVDVPEVMGDTPMALEELRPKEPVSSLDMAEEWRILIKIHVLVGSMKLEDQFEWDLACTTNSPEQFALQYTSELGLSGEFTTAIAHQIREQVYVYRKAILSGLAGQPVEDDDLRPTFLPPLTRSTIARTLDNANGHMPLLNYLSDGEIERNEREREKEIKRKRRTIRSKTAGGAFGQFTTGNRIMPDRTYRTPGIGFPEVDNAALSGQGPQGSVGVTATTSRRAAAAAASLTIANMVASENGGSPIQMNMPDLLPMRPVRETPKKGLMPPPQHPSQPPQKSFKPPALPPTVYRSRAKLAVPPPSTSLDPSKYRRRLGSTKGMDTIMDDDDDGASLLPPPPPPPLPPARLTAKQLRDLEKEAKEREYAEGQHENVINGIWHCSNCGCPDNIAVGRRKGPLGDKSQCGPCGKFYHRHRRPRPVEYRIDPEYHLKLRNESEKGKGGVGKRKGVGRPSAASTEAMRKKKEEEEKEDEDEKDDEKDEKEKETEKDDEKDEKEKEEDKDDYDDDGKEGTLKPVSMNSNASIGNSNDLGIVPVGAASPTDSSSSEEPPLALKNTAEKPQSASPSAPVSENPSMTNVAASLSQGLPPPPPSSSSSPLIPRHSPAPPATKTTAKVSVQRPEWLRRALDEMQARYPEDRFDVVLRKSTDPNAPPEWRVKCHDCPGKLYTPGPEETLANFDVHLKNRKHRAQVNARINNTTPPPQ